jgi:hypothetical protein
VTIPCLFVPSRFCACRRRYVRHMPRHPRLQASDVLYHVGSRGVEKRSIFERAPRDREVFMDLLDEVVQLLRVAFVCLLPDGEPLPSRPRHAGRQPLRRHAAPQRGVRAMAQRCGWAGGGVVTPRQSASNAAHASCTPTACSRGTEEDARRAPRTHGLSGTRTRFYVSACYAAWMSQPRYISASTASVTNCVAWRGSANA